MKSAEMLSAMFYDKFIVLDTESTGFQPNNTYSKLLEIGAVKVEKGIVVDRFDRLINPGIKIPNKITTLTGITDEMVETEEDYTSVLKEFKEWCEGDYVFVGHNIPHDLKFLEYSGQQCGLNFDNPYIDTRSIAKSILKDGTWNKINSRINENYKLASLAILFEIPDKNHHRADNDAELTWLVLKSLKNTYLKKKPEAIYTKWLYPKIEVAKKEYEVFVLSASPWDKGERLYVTLSSTFDNEEHFSYVYFDFKKHCWGVKNCSFPVPFDKLTVFIEKMYNSLLKDYSFFRERLSFKNEKLV